MANATIEQLGKEGVKIEHVPGDCLVTVTIPEKTCESGAYWQVYPIMSPLMQVMRALGLLSSYNVRRTERADLEIQLILPPEHRHLFDRL